MAKHAKPTATSTLSKSGARGAATLAMISVGFLATAPAASASGDDPGHHDHGDGDIGYRWSNDTVDAHESQGIVNVAGNTVAVPVQVCHNSVPVTVAGVQAPLEDVAATAAVSSDGDGQVGVWRDSCHQTTHRQH